MRTEMNSNVQVGAKRKTITNVLYNEVTKWLNSLPDSIRYDVANDVIVTGGSIASMLLGEPVKDFDIYLKSRYSAEIIAKYYVEKYNERIKKDPNKAQAYVHRYEPETMRKSINGDVVGIFISGYTNISPDEENEEDLPEGFFTNTEEPEALEKYHPVFLSQNAITLSDKIQIVIRFTGDVEEIHKNYDYVHATCSYDYIENRLTLPPQALESMLARELVYTGSLYPICSLFRMRKFMERGWRISAGEIVKMAIQISQLNLSNVTVLKQQLIGVDAAYFSALLHAMSEHAEGDEFDQELLSEWIIDIIDQLAERDHV
jgi:hypothetical protein